MEKYFAVVRAIDLSNKLSLGKMVDYDRLYGKDSHFDCFIQNYDFVDWTQVPQWKFYHPHSEYQADKRIDR